VAVALTALEQLIALVHQHRHWLYGEIAPGCHSPPATAGEDVCMEGAHLAFVLLCFVIQPETLCDLPVSLESTCVASAANGEFVEIIGSAPQQPETAANLAL